MNEEKDFKVIDRRSSSEANPKDEKSKVTPPKAGDGFVMKDSPSESKGPDQLDFSTFVFSLATGAFIHMGLAPDPNTHQTAKNLDLARQNIDLLSILEKKTKGNLTDDESRLLEGLLMEVRLKFVEVSKEK